MTAIQERQLLELNDDEGKKVLINPKIIDSVIYTDNYSGKSEKTIDDYKKNNILQYNIRVEIITSEIIKNKIITVAGLHYSDKKKADKTYELLKQHCNISACM